MLAIYTLAARLLINLNFPFGEKVPFLHLAPTPYKGLALRLQSLQNQAKKSKFSRNAFD